MSDQAIGFLLEFRNEASEDLQQATTDFDKATEALEEAVDAAQAAFTFLEEGTSQLAKSLGGAVDAAVKKTGDLKAAMGELGSVEVSAPDFNPIEEAMEDLGDNIAAPFEAGVETIEDVVDDINENTQNIKIPAEMIWATFNSGARDAVDAVEEIAKETKHVNSLAADYVRTLDLTSDKALQVRSDARKLFEGLDSSLALAGSRLYKETIPGLEEFGEKGKNAAAAIAGDAVEAYERLQGAAGDFFTENREAFAQAKDASEVWKGFVEAEDSDVRKVQDLLRVADKATLEPLVQGLVDQLGDAALAEEFWKPIADNKNVDREFFTDLRKSFLKENKTYKTWWDKMGSTAQKFFWPVYKKQGEKANDGIAKSLGKKMKSVFASPIGQFVAALQLSSLITKVFGPALDVLAEIISTALMPIMRLFVDLMDEVSPLLHEVTRAVFPLFEALAELAGEFLKGIVPVVRTFVDLLMTFTPLIVSVARTVGGVVNFVFTSFGYTLKWVGEVLSIVTGILGFFLDALMFLLKPVINLVVLIDEWTGVSKALGFILSVFLLPILWSMATTLIPQMIAGMWKLATANSGVIASTWKYVAAMTASTWAAAKDSTAMVWNTAVKWWNSKATIAGTIATGASTVVTWAATAAAWAFNTALLANPIVWIVLAVVAAIALLVGAVWLLWEPIMAVFGWFGDLIGGLVDWVQDLIAGFGDFGIVIKVALGPIGLMIIAFEYLVELFDWIFGAGDDSENTFSLSWISDGIDWLTDWMFEWLDMLPGWVKWLLGLDDAEVPDEAGPDDIGGVSDAEDMVSGISEGAASEAEDQPDWFKSMWGIDSTKATEEVATAASDSANEVGVNATEAMTKPGSAGFLGTMEEAGATAGFSLLGGLAAGMFSFAAAFPLTNIMGAMFGGFASIFGSPATEQAKAPSMAGVNVGVVDYQVEAEVSGEEIAKPIVEAITLQTRSLSAAIENSGAKDLELDLTDLKDIAGFG